MTKAAEVKNKPVQYFCAGPVSGVYTQEEAEKLKRPNIAGHKKRKGCGYSLSKLISKVPMDGERHEVNCPACKNVAIVSRSPPLQETEAPSEKE